MLQDPAERHLVAARAEIHVTLLDLQEKHGLDSDQMLHIVSLWMTMILNFRTQDRKAAASDA